MALLALKNNTVTFDDAYIERVVYKHSKRVIPAFMVVLLILASCVWGSHRTTIILSENWHIKQLDTDEPDVAALTRAATSPDNTWLRVRMPAQVHDILFQHGKISDPHVGKNAADSAWVGEQDWVYACRFASPTRGEGPVFLRFEGLDTLATVYLNGRKIGYFNNMYREYAVDVREQLAPAGQDNVLLIVFSSPLRFINQVKRPQRYKSLGKYKWLRKSHGDFSSYLGARPHAVKVGVFRDVVLDVPGQSWIEDVWVRPKLSKNFKSAKLQLSIKIGGADAQVHWLLKDPAGKEIGGGETRNSVNGLDFRVAVKNPKLWWPRTHGRQNLYQIEVTLKNKKGRLDSRSVSFGIRDVRPVLKDPQTGQKRFRFDVNGQPIFMRGACWAPLEGMTHCWDSERAERLLDLLEHGRMNVLRIWGEGHIPPRRFYDECDKRGIFIWQDFMFGYNMHPSGEPEFDENCRLEIEGMIRMLRNHPCILLWAGGNENHMGWNFGRGDNPTIGLELFHKIMPEACAKLDPDRLFHPSSPYGGKVPNWPLEGDWHDYTTLKFCPDASVPLYASEVGRASAPSLSSMKLFLSDEDLWPQGYSPAIRTPGRAAWPPMWQYRSVGGSWDKVGRVGEYCDPSNAEELIRVLGMAHGEYLRDRVERERRGVPDGSPDGNRRCWGNMIWRLNDSWPIIYWSVIDYYLEPKIPFYLLRRAYEPVLISFERTRDTIAVWVVNDSPEPVSGKLEVHRLRFDGKSRGQLQAQVEIGPGQAKRCLVTTDLGPIYLRNEFLHATFGAGDATYLLTGERYLHLPKAKLTVRTVGDKIEITTNVFARTVTLEMEGVTGAVFEDNFFDMVPGQKRTITVVNPAGGRALTIRALNAAPVQLKLSHGKGLN
ncbi:MAG TPA: glycoside hydrolase family 2 protein [Sedimentisphaerales bacterium]|nr:glycoside hydrolase family 2 protein [Sedimentisphaerales bacterium]